MIRNLDDRNRRLLETLLRHEPDLLHEVAVAEAPSDEAIQKIHEILADELTSKGLDANLEPTEYGRELESLGIALSYWR